ncbi:uncharacterized protein LOC144344739, partial [Saccoglossus kowalevskii]
EIDSVFIVDHYDDEIVDIKAGEATKYTCSIIDGNPETELTWTIGGKDITEYNPPVIHVIEVVNWDDHSVTVKCVDTANPDSHRYEWEADRNQTGDTEDDNTWKFRDTYNDLIEN